ncbi:MAG: 5-(carboxyamino)imidazole ribonucleotide synthase [Pirellulales bacterium]
MTAPDSSRILPGRTLGILGGGQLGSMFAMAASRMGYRVEAISDVADCPAARHCDRLHVGDYTDTALLARVAAGLDVVTFEFENIPVATGRALAAAVPVRPCPEVLFTTQDRGREKAFLTANGFACVPYRLVRSRDELRAAAAALGLPAVLKTAAFGYDGKGQCRITATADIDAAWERLAGAANGPPELVLEAWIDFDCEISVVAARGVDGTIAAFAPSRNAHAHHILDVSSVPAGLPEPVLAEATAITSRILVALDVIGVACVEFFVTRDGRVLVNEIAPRTHNSGHLTIEACDTSQFEQQVRAICGLPLGSTRQRSPAAMANLLGDCWRDAATGEFVEPDWAAALAVPGVSLHLYGKQEPRPGRKMGHLTAVADTVDEAIARVTRARKVAARS